MAKTKKKRNQKAALFSKKQKAKRSYVTERYDKARVHEERELGIYWYAIVWKILRPVLLFACSLLIVVGILSTAWTRVYDEFLGPADALNAEVVEFNVEDGSTVTSIGNQLEEEGLMHYGKLFKYIVQLRGLTENVGSGSFELSKSMTVLEIVDALTSQNPSTRERTITIVPGWTCEDIADYLVSEGIIDDTAEFLALCNDTDRFAGASYALTDAQTNGTMTGRKYALEGYLAPNTYRIYASASVESIIGTLLSQDNTLIDDVYYGDSSTYVMTQDGVYEEVDPNTGEYTMDEIIIMASIIEKEASNATDYARVSAVFHNRLSQGMKLESDPTATYLSGENKLVLTESEIADQNPYNTYYISGLPVGPICTPSRAALQAAMQPDAEYVEENYLYFCTGEPGTGTLLFAKTLEEHSANVAKYRESWEAYDASHD